MAPLSDSFLQNRLFTGQLLLKSPHLLQECRAATFVV